MTEKVVVLSHVKMSSVPAAASNVRRIPWLGGKIKSNKEEALRKFYERKITSGGQLNDRQIDALQKTCACVVCLLLSMVHVKCLALCRYWTDSTHRVFVPRRLCGTTERLSSGDHCR